MSCSSNCCGTADFFGDRIARRNIRKYRRSGPYGHHQAAAGGPRKGGCPEGNPARCRRRHRDDRARDAGHGDVARGDRGREPRVSRRGAGRERAPADGGSPAPAARRRRRAARRRRGRRRRDAGQGGVLLRGHGVVDRHRRVTRTAADGARLSARRLVGARDRGLRELRAAANRAATFAATCIATPRSRLHSAAPVSRRGR